MEAWMTPDTEEGKRTPEKEGLEKMDLWGVDEEPEEEPDEEEESGSETRGLEWFLGNIRDCIEFLAFCWAFLMLTVFPVYVIDRYQDIGAYKFSFFSGVSTLLLVPGCVLAAIYLAGRAVWMKGQGMLWLSSWKERISGLDLCVMAYLVCNLISYALSDYKQEAWDGVSGWNMGLKTQVFMIAAYFLLSRFLVFRRNGSYTRSFHAILIGAMAGSGAAFLLGVLHRFGIDPFGFYEGLDETYQLLFLSAIGQATWYSSYVCTVFPIGLCLFFCSEKRRVRFWTGIYCALGFMTIVTQNSDSAFAAMALLFLGLFLFSASRPKRLERFLEILILCGASFKAMGIAQQIFVQRAMSLGRLSTAFSQGSISWFILLLGASIYILLLKMEEKKGEEGLEKAWEKLRIGRRLRAAAAALALLAVAGCVAFIALNTSGLLERWFGISSDNQYLLFNDNWGSNRGFTWKTSAEIFASMPARKKLFGVGPDCFMPYSYGIPEFASRLNDYWKPNVLTNAHNEYLNLLICIGLAGMLAFVAMLIATAVRFSRKGAQYPLALMGMLTVCAYAAHNFFCYQQVCCTPFLFLILALAERIVRDGVQEKTERNTIIEEGTAVPPA